MDSVVSGLKHLTITGVNFTDHVVAAGAFGSVFSVEHNGIQCAAKVIHSDLLCSGETERSKIEQYFLQQYLQGSVLQHPNVVKMLGVCYRNDEAGVPWPVVVMELMERNLTRLLKDYQNIPAYVKLSILQDVSRGLCYLHTQNPPVLMQGSLDSDSILLTGSLTAKIYIFGVMKPLFLGKITKVLGTADFMAPEAFAGGSHYGLPLDVFSFGCVVCHVITQQCPVPCMYIAKDPKTRKPLFTEVEKRKCYIDQVVDGPLKQLMVTCLEDIPERRPPISLVSDRITSIMTS